MLGTRLRGVQHAQARPLRTTARITRRQGFCSRGRITEAIIATGPKRRLVAETNLPIYFGAPYGDNMMTGTVGLLEAIRRHKQMQSISYV